MRSKLKAIDLLVPGWVCVRAFDRYRDIVLDTKNSPSVFIVIDEDHKFLGLVEERQAALFPGRIFADLLVRRSSLTIPADFTPEQVLEVIENSPTEHLAIVDEYGLCVGVTSRVGVFAALIESEHSLRDEREALIKRLEADLADRQIAAAVFDATSEGIMVTDDLSRIILINNAFTETTGYTREEILGENPKILQSNRHDNTFYVGMWQQMKETGSWEGEIWNRRKNGEIYPEWLHINTILNEAGDITHYAGVFSDITKHKELRKKLHHLAYHDALTDLPNRQLLKDRIEQSIAQTRRYRSNGFALLFLDLDGFKEINDSLGHSIGDQVLVYQALRLRDSMREVDTVARLGGDEFVVVLDQGHEESMISATAAKILGILAKPVFVGGRELHLTASVGISRYPEDGETVDDLLRAADTAMYQAKEDGKNTFRFHSPEMHERIMAHITLVAELRQVLAVGGLTLAWQPQVSLRDGQVTGMEALSRWVRQDGLAITPETFISLAEQTGLIGTLSNWVFRQACQEAAEMLATCPDCANRFAVNLSPLHAHSTTFNDIMGALAASGLNPHLLEIELTENSISTGHEVLALLRSLGEIGIQTAVDDFGTGCSNIATIKLLPIQRLKLDRSFVMDITRDTNDRDIAVAIISMAHALGLEVVAEGVETAEQAAILAEAGCDHAQGYLYSRPQAKDDIINWLHEHGCHCATREKD